MAGGCAKCTGVTVQIVCLVCPYGPCLTLVDHRDVQASEPSSSQPFASSPQSAPGVGPQSSAAGFAERPGIQMPASGGHPLASVPLPTGASHAFAASTRPQNYLPGVSASAQLLRQPVLSTLGDLNTQQTQQPGLPASAQQPGFSERQPGTFALSTGAAGTSIPAPGLPSAQPVAAGQPGTILSQHLSNTTAGGVAIQGAANGREESTGEQRAKAGTGAQADSIEAAGQLPGSSAGTTLEGPVHQERFAGEEPFELLL